MSSRHICSLLKPAGESSEVAGIEESRLDFGKGATENILKGSGIAQLVGKVRY